MKIRKLLTATVAATALTAGMATPAQAQGDPAALANGSFEQIGGSWTALPPAGKEMAWYLMMPAALVGGLLIMLIQGTTGICISSDTPDCGPLY